MHPEFPTSENAILRAIKIGSSAWATALAGLVLIAAPVARAQTLWVGGTSTDWYTAGNWNPSVVPTGGGDVEINTNSGVQPVISGGSAATNILYVGYDSASGGNTVLTVQAGGSLATNGAGYVGYNAGSSGLVTIDGANSTWSLNGNSLNGNSLLVGANGSGTLTITNGASVTSRGSSIADQSGSNGSVNVAGTNSAWTISGNFTIGNNGAGSFFVLNGANVGVTGLVTAGSGGGGHGSIVVDGANAKLNLSQDLVVGFAANSNLTIANGGSIVSTQGELGIQNGTTTALVTGANSTWNMGTGSLSVAELTQANLTIANGAIVSSNGVTMGFGPAANATVLVTGIGAVWNTGTSGSLVVGVHGSANLTIANGGVVNAWIVDLSKSGGVAHLSLNQNGVLQVGGSNGLEAGSANYTMTWGGGILRVVGADLTTALNATLSPGTASTIDTNGFNATFSGTLSGGGSLIKAGNGTLNLNGGDSYTGNTSVTGGNLNVGGNIIVPSGVTLQINGTLVASQISVAPGGILTGNGTITGNLVNNGSVTLTSGPGQRLTVHGNLTNNGLVSLLNGTGMTVSGAATNGASAVFDVTTGATPAFGSFANAGVYAVAHDVRILDVETSGTNLVVSIQTYPGHNYQLQGCADLTKAQWANVGSPVPGTGGVITLSDGLAFFTGPLLFYRVQVAP